MKIRKVFAEGKKYMTKTGVADVPFENYELRSANSNSPIVKYNGGVWDELLSYICEEIAIDIGNDLADDELTEIKRRVRNSAEISIVMDMKHMRLFSDVDEVTNKHTTYHAGLAVFYDIGSYGCSGNFTSVLLLTDAELRRFVSDFFGQTYKQARMDHAAFEIHKKIANAFLR